MLVFIVLQAPLGSLHQASLLVIATTQGQYFGRARTRVLHSPYLRYHTLCNPPYSVHRLICWHTIPVPVLLRPPTPSSPPRRCDPSSNAIPAHPLIHPSVHSFHGVHRFRMDEPLLDSGARSRKDPLLAKAAPPPLTDLPLPQLPFHSI